VPGCGPRGDAAASGDLPTPGGDREPPERRGVACLCAARIADAFPGDGVQDPRHAGRRRRGAPGVAARSPWAVGRQRDVASPPGLYSLRPRDRRGGAATRRSRAAGRRAGGSTRVHRGWPRDRDLRTLRGLPWAASAGQINHSTRRERARSECWMTSVRRRCARAMSSGGQDQLGPQMLFYGPADHPPAPTRRARWRDTGRRPTSARR
jgi:hypothetical protein